jgi:hypothetical protein
MRTLIVVETQIVPAGWFCHHWVKDFPQQRESVGTWYLSCPPLLASQEQERETLSKKRKNVR